jgi:hypothetical protein
MVKNNSLIYRYWKWRTSQFLIIGRALLPEKLKYRLDRRKIKARQQIKKMKTISGFTRNRTSVSSMRNQSYCEDLTHIRKTRDRIIEKLEERKVFADCLDQGHQGQDVNNSTSSHSISDAV